MLGQRIKRHPMSQEDIKLKVKIVDEDLLFDDYITNFAMVLDVRNKESFKQHTVQHTSPQGSGLFRLTYEVTQLTSRGKYWWEFVCISQGLSDVIKEQSITSYSQVK